MTGGLREMLGRGGAVAAPGVGDALGALLVREAGFLAVSVSGYYLAATMGYPDVGLVTLSELAGRTALICEAAGIPVIVDGDNGYGNVINVMRTVKELERAGAAAIVIEDQVLPKKCGGTAGIELVSTAEMVGKVRAATDTRRDPGTLIIARTDALYVAGGMKEAIERAALYKEAGADVIFAHGLKTETMLREFRAGVEGSLMVGLGTSVEFPLAQVEEHGYQIAIYSLTLLRSGMAAMRRTLRELRASGQLDHASSDFVPVSDLHRFLGMNRIAELEERYAGTSGSEP
jgi:2-methylisocitrate lyase-like PEP mutase family enzyme